MTLWIQLKLTARPEIVEPLEQTLQNNGAVSITLQDHGDQPIYEPELGTEPLWSSLLLTALFPANLDMKSLINEITTEFTKLMPCEPFPAYEYDALPDKDWEREWLKYYQPLKFHGNFWVVPSWITLSKPNAKVMRLDPGLAFGTGTHETTSLCLSWLAKNQALLQQPECKLIDFGCGSGILGIAAVILGTHRVQAIDIDPQALTATEQNAALNNLTSEQIKIFSGNEDLIAMADIIVANILFEPLIALSNDLINSLKPGGHLIMSGVLGSQVKALETHYKKWVSFEQTVHDGDWALLYGRKI